MKKFFQKIGAWVSKVFGSTKKAEKFIEDHVDDVIAVVSKILYYSNSPFLFTALIQLLPEKYKNASQEAQEKLVAVLTKAMDYLNISADCLGKPTEYEKILCFVHALSQKSEVMKNKTGLALASKMVQMEKPELPESVADSMITSRIAEKKVSSLMAG